MLPLRFPDHRDPRDVGEVFDGELGVLPQRAVIPTVEVCHIEQDSQFAVLADEPLEFWHEVFVVRTCQLAADMHVKQLTTVSSLS